MKAELEKLHKKVLALPAREQEMLRLHYQREMNFAAIAKATETKPAVVASLLLQALNQLRDVKKSSVEGDFLGFVWGELDEAATAQMAERVEKDKKAQKEFESLLALSDQLADLYAELPKISDKKASKSQPASAFPVRWAAAGFFAVDIGIVTYIALDSTPDTEAPPSVDTAPVAADTAPAPAATETTALETQPPTDPTAAPAPEASAEATPAEAAPQPAPEPTPEPPPMPAPVAAAPATTKSPATKHKTMLLESDKTVVSKNLNKKKTLAWLKQKLHQKPSCLPKSDQKTRLIQATVQVARDGKVAGVTVKAPSSKKSTVALCLRERLGSSLGGKTADKNTGKISLALKIK